MRDFRDAKAMAQTLREALAARSIPLTHSESLELVAKILGVRDWNVLSARIQSQAQQPAESPAILMRATLPVVPLRDIVLFPNMVSPIFIGREKTKRAVEYAVANDSDILGVAQLRAADDAPTADALYSVGVTAKLVDLTLLSDGNIRAIIKMLDRAAVAQFVEGDFLSAEITPVEDSRGLDPEAFKLARSVLEKLAAYLNIDFSLPQAPYARLPHIREPGAFADAVAPFLPIEMSQRQDLLETGDVIVRLEKILAIVTTDRRAA